MASITRKIDDFGRVCIPGSLRSRLEMKCGSSVEIFLSGSGQTVEIKKHKTECALCGKESEDMIMYKDHFICKSCLAELNACLHEIEEEEIDE